MALHWGGEGGGMGFGRRTWELRQAAKQETFDWPVLRRALASYLEYRWRVVTAALLLLSTAILSVLPALLEKRIINDGIERGNVRLVVGLAAAIVMVALLSGVASVLGTWFTQIIGQHVMADYRQRIYHHLLAQPLQFFTQSKTGDLVSRTTNDVAAIQTVVTSTLSNFVQNIFSIIAALSVMFTQSWQLTLLSLLVLPAFIVPVQRTGQRRRDLQAEIQTTLGRMTAQLAETLGVSGALLVKAFHKESDEEARFQRDNETLRDLQIRQSLIGRWLFMWLSNFSIMGPALLWGYGGWLVIHHRLSLGVIVAFVTLLVQLYSPMSQLAQLHVNVLTSVALFRRIFAILDLTPAIQDGPHIFTPTTPAPSITLDHVWFRYPTDSERPLSWALEDVSLDIASGQLVALVGPSGAGKTTLLHLIPRFHDPVRGRVLIDGRDLREFTLTSLRTYMGLVPQDPFLFHDTVMANLRYAQPDATEEDIVRATKAAQIHETIMAMPQGYDTIVGERGHRLSGGEKQRLAIARVLLRNPGLVLLDEATSSLDTLSERRIQQAFQHLLDGRTVIVIAHRLSTILAADQIVVLNQGHVVDIGTHATLLAKGGLYAHLYREQFQPSSLTAESSPRHDHRAPMSGR
ncbi:MAG: ABC transporter ATP-binding protein [Firmicutes bacterium]|nr:ABC transporter ATP-binding protein [Bacillota bacterium]